MVSRDSSTRYVKGDPRCVGNKHAVGNPPNKTSFKKGNVPANSKPLNKPRARIHKRDGVDVIVTAVVGKNKKQIAYARLVVGLANIPSGHVVYHLDGDRLNYDKSNLEIISRGELLRRNLGRK